MPKLSVGTIILCAISGALSYYRESFEVSMKNLVNSNH